MNYFYLLDQIDCSDVKILIDVLKFVILIFQFLVPGALIILGVITLFKAMTSGDEKVQNGAWKKLGMKFVYAFVIFLVPTLVRFIFNFVGKHVDGTNSTEVDQFFQCYSGTTTANGSSTSTYSTACYDSNNSVVNTNTYVGTDGNPHFCSDTQYK